MGNSGQNTVADLAVAASPGIVIAEDRLFGEQRAVAVTDLGMAGVVRGGGTDTRTAGPGGRQKGPMSAPQM